MWCGQASGIDELRVVFGLIVFEGETSMQNEEVTGKLKSVFQKVLGKNDITITRETTAEDIEAWDSLRHIQLISEVERAFEIRFKLREVLSMKNVGDLIDLVHAKQRVPA
jgi:acyl carrier protein